MILSKNLTLASSILLKPLALRILFNSDFSPVIGLLINVGSSALEDGFFFNEKP